MFSFRLKNIENDKAYNITQYCDEHDRNTRYFIQKDCGEGMSITPNELFNIIDKFYNENF